MALIPIRSFNYDGYIAVAKIRLLTIIVLNLGAIR